VLTENPPLSRREGNDPLQPTTAALAGWLLLGNVAQERTFTIIPHLSQATYAVDEVFLNENNRLFTAVGLTRQVTGTIQLDPARPDQSRVAEVVVDLRQLTTDNVRRDRAVRDGYLHTDRFPQALLTDGRLSETPVPIPEGQSFHYRLVANLTVHGVSRETTWQGEATVKADTLRGVARTRIRMSTFGIEVPRLLTLRSEDDVQLEIRYVASASPP
jgi:polyisoprenoid-binding protein YceI